MFLKTLAFYNSLLIDNRLRLFVFVSPYKNNSIIRD